MFEPDPNCESMDGTGTLKICVVKACHLSSLSRVSNLSRVRAFCSLLPQFYPTRERTPKYEIGSNPTWEYTFTYTDLKLQYLLEEAAVDISVTDTNSYIGHIRLGGYPSRSKNHQPWMDSTEREAAHWEEMLSNPGKWVVRWHQIDESLDARKVDLSIKPPVFIEPTFELTCGFQQYASDSASIFTTNLNDRLRQQVSNFIRLYG